MAEKKTTPKKISQASTKQELLDAYNTLLQEIQEDRQAELKPDTQREEKKVKEALDAAEALSAEGVSKQISSLKMDVGKMLTGIADSLEAELGRLDQLKKAIAYKEEEIRDLYQIDKNAASLAALIEAQNRRRNEFEEEMACRKAELEGEIASLRARWEEDKQARDQEAKAWASAEKQRRDREREEFLYAFEREKKLANDKYEDEKATLDKEIRERREELEKTLVDREKAVAEKEAELAELRKRAAAFPKELEAAVAQAVKEVSNRLQAEAKAREDLLKKEFEGERNVFTTRIASLEKTGKEQADQLTKLAGQLEKAYQKIEDVAVKTIEGSAQTRAYANLQQLVADQLKKQAPEK